jgi:hypothetical protein
MRTYLTSLLVAALLGHSLVECVSHSGRACADCGTSAASIVAAPACCDERAISSDEPGHLPVRPCDCQWTDASGCRSLLPQRTFVEALQLRSAHEIAAPVPATCRNAIAACVGRWGGESGDSAPPLRLHLLHQILLI